jgi:predicted DNA-binding transcriptional regulator AlpA
VSVKEASTGTKLMLVATGEPSGRPVDRQLTVVEPVDGAGRKRRPSALPDNLPPRGLYREQAAEYICVGTTTWDKLVAEGRMPKPKRIGGRVVWDRHAIDKAFAALDGGEEADNPYARMA